MLAADEALGSDGEMVEEPADEETRRPFVVKGPVSPTAAEVDEHEALEITRRIRALLPTVGFAVERVGVNRRADVEFGREPHYIPRWPTPDKPPLAPIDE